jgi:hypothetical protein
VAAQKPSDTNHPIRRGRVEEEGEAAAVVFFLLVVVDGDDGDDRDAALPPAAVSKGKGYLLSSKGMLGMVLSSECITPIAPSPPPLPPVTGSEVK